MERPGPRFTDVTQRSLFPQEPTEPPERPAQASPEELVERHLALVGHLVRETLTRVPAHVNRDDLLSAGMTALWLAARSFDASRGIAFGAYAATRVRGALLDELRSLDWASRSVRRRARELAASRDELSLQLGRAATDAEVARATGLSLPEVTRNEEDVTRASVLSLHGFGETPIDEIVTSTSPSPEVTLEKAEQARFLAAAVAELPERLRVVVEGYFLAERGMAEIAAELGVSESRISQMRAEALVLLREVMRRTFGPDPDAAAPAGTGVVARRRAAYIAAVDARASSQRAQARPGSRPVAS